MGGRTLTLLLVFWVGLLGAQTCSLNLSLRDSISGKSLPGVLVWAESPRFMDAVTGAKGTCIFGGLESGEWRFRCVHLGYMATTLLVEIGDEAEQTVSLTLIPLELDLGTAEVEGRTSREMISLRAVEAGSVFSGMKSHLIRPEARASNLVSSRQVYAKVPGLNIWESDGAGIQLGIGGRGLSPNRTSHFNVRQNGFDISADPLGYPESYYTPPLEAVERIDVVRGAGALQYGTQFGGLINFRMKHAHVGDSLVVVAKQTFGTYGLRDTISPALASSNSVVHLQGSLPSGVTYFGFYQHKRGAGWRPNGDYRVHTGHINLQYAPSDHSEWGIEFTHMDYLAQQSGGLLDSQFEQDPRRAFRERNWFAVNWNLAAVHNVTQFSPLTEWRTTAFGLAASRKALGFLGQAGRVDFEENNRDLIWGEFRNVGVESRLLHRVNIRERIGVLLLGARFFQGNSHARQGTAPAGSEPTFTLSDPDTFAGTDYRFPNTNLTLFTQNIIPLGKHLSLTPGVRLEHISTRAKGTVLETVLNGAGQIVDDTLYTDTRSRSRTFLLAGMGLSYQPEPHFELYANAVQNYRAINFSDIQVQGLSIVVDPNIQDERGANLDLGIRGDLKGKMQYDISAFALFYRDRIGAYNTAIADPVLVQRVIRYRTNVSNARILGLEGLVQGTVRLGEDTDAPHVHWFVNCALTHGEYLSNGSDADSLALDVAGNRVELVPAVTSKVGAAFAWRRFTFSTQYTYTSEQFTDATNAERTPGAVDGLVPAYAVLDFGAKWQRGRVTLEANLNNALNTPYFTRRAAGYPGPGIIPADGRAFFLGVGVQI